MRSVVDAVRFRSREYTLIRMFFDLPTRRSAAFFKRHSLDVLTTTTVRSVVYIFAGRRQALSVSFRGPCLKPTSTSSSSITEPTTGSPSKRSSARRFSRPRRT